MALLTVEAVLFDLDGTLVDSLDDIAASANHMLRELGYPTHSRDAIRSFVGEGARHLIAQTLPNGSSEAVIDQGLAIYQARYRAHLTVHSRPYQGIVEMLAALRAADVPLAVVTNKPQGPASAMVDGLFEGIFGAVIGEEAGRPRKPDPQPLHDAARLLGVRPEACAFVGDTAVDMRAARAAKMFALGVTWGFRDGQDLLDGGAELLMQSVPELARLLISASS